MTTLIIVPVLRRPHRVVPLLDSIEAATPEPHRTLFVCDPDDEAERLAIDAAGADHVDIEGGYARKVNAVYEQTTEPRLFLGADDLQFHPGWLAAALAALAALDDGIGVVGTNDLGNPRVMNGEHATHSLVTRDYADRLGTLDQPGQVLCERYRHNFVDDELRATAQHRGAWVFASGSRVEHLHPNWGKGQEDDTYRLGQASFVVDQRLFQKRRRLWGGAR